MQWGKVWFIMNGVAATRINIIQNCSRELVVQRVLSSQGNCFCFFMHYLRFLWNLLFYYIFSLLYNFWGVLFSLDLIGFFREHRLHILLLLLDCKLTILHITLNSFENQLGLSLFMKFGIGWWIIYAFDWPIRLINKVLNLLNKI
jgi:hypothetical protein